tara:strand:+ start:11613 stop:11813 length:201 start_codon:yes stop_codon:yes gene_type:complete
MKKYNNKSTSRKKAKMKKGLTKAQKAKLKLHSVHHTKKHMNEMEKLMKQGLSFNFAHNMAMKKVGK